ncbi:MAG TPA: alkaline phosphatase D family protein [Thermoleophilaceae bacterium]|nr:alkaline phosphatase D family protein [Thermoleophilaceae bacterium]
MIRAIARSLPLAVAAVLLLAPPALAARGFSLGVTAGEVTASSAVLWGKAAKSGGYSLDIARNRRFTRGFDAHLVRARKGHDNTLQLRVKGLRPGARYWFRFVGDRARSDVGTFVTAPAPKQNATVEFAWSGDTDFNPEPGKSAPYWNDGGVFRQMKAERNDFNVSLGDTIYSDSEVPGVLQPIALSVEQKWAKYRINLGNRHLRALRGSAGFYSHWDDHEFVNDFSPAESSFDNDVNVSGSTLYKRGAEAFRDYAPVRWTKRDGLYRTVRWGRNLELFFLDERSFRSANADEGGVCNNPQTGKPDLAPTAPQSTRTVFAAAYPPFAQPVPQACLDRIRSADRTYLGKRQLSRFLREVKRSTARFKVIMNELAIQQYYLNAYDRWEGFEADRQRVLSGLQGVKNLIFLTTDVHATLVNDARFQTLEQGGARDSGILDVTVGPAATANFGLEIDVTTGVSGTGTLADSAFFTPPPPGGMGMQCSIVDQFSYGQVKVTGTRLTVTPKDIDGKPQRDGARPCGPFVLNYQR